MMWVFWQTYGVKPGDAGAEFAVGFYDQYGKPSQRIKKIGSILDAMLLVSFLNGGSISQEDVTRIVHDLTSQA